ncbi:hypothetical protein SAMN05443245_6792 [Paraburkholderia fungorum]|uniref:Uncharacterized protein n=1 Tax=Paraburkholderia fungorum TaxID=134537 RepID=A0A1H1JLY3_9BURK|nr:hypothetical protein [Paraburkholderia fungorum]SDR50920.1 hypothetical protein SAMN05443245_6792 [Paraburkholderia fungorum]
MKRLFLATLTALSVISCAHAQSSASNSLATRSGTLQFTHVDRGFEATLDQQSFDRFTSNTLTHFDDIDSKHDTISRMLVQTDSGPVLYDFQRRPPTVQHANQRMTIKRVFWQDDEVVMQGSQGWFRFRHGEFSKLQSSKTIYH